MEVILKPDQFDYLVHYLFSISYDLQNLPYKKMFEKFNKEVLDYDDYTASNTSRDRSYS